MNATTKKSRGKARAWNPIKELVDNAVDFLTLATDEFKARPKHSIINFHSAVELFLKARLMQEHWSLVVSKTPDLDSFKAGDFVSVTFDEACHRLAKIVGSPLPEPTRAAFDVIRKHRNRLVHFFQDLDDEAVREKIAVEQLSAWHGLVMLLKGDWREVFSAFQLDLDSLDRKFAAHRLYLKTRFDSLKPELDRLRAEGRTLVACDRCRFDAAETEVIAGDLHRANCHVCNFTPRWLELDCGDCGGKFRAVGEEEAICGCGVTYSQEDIADMVDEDPATTDNYFEHQTPANCSFCDGYETVVSYAGRYICVGCLELTEGLGSCGWCNEANNGDMEGSEWKGCNFCDGRRGWDRD